MNTRIRTLASFFSIATASMIVGGVISTQVQRPEAAQAQQATAESKPAARDAVITLDTFKEVSKRVTAGVVNISSSTIVKRGSGTPDALREFFGEELPSPPFGQGGRGGRSRREMSLGSGFVIDKAGYILTNRHVVQDADEITVTLANDKTYEAKLVGRDARTDVALLKIEPKETLTVVPMGNSDQTEPGEWVIAIGNPFNLGGNSVTVGVVSYKGRPLPLAQQNNPVEMIQTDASINPGNSGGPLLNLRGEVIGINTMIITRGLPQSAGVGFAVPINVAKDILPQLRDKGKVTRGWMGVQIWKVDEDIAKTFGLKEPKGALVMEVQAGSPAEKAGLKPDDLILTVDGKEVVDNSFLSRYIAAKAPGTSVKLGLQREGADKTVTLTLETFPDVDDERSGGEEKTSTLGMKRQTLTPTLAESLDMPRGTKGVVVMETEAGEAADDAGLSRGDVIVSVNGVPVQDVDAFDAEIDKARKSGLARLRVRRGEQYFLAVLKLS